MRQKPQTDYSRHWIAYTSPSSLVIELWFSSGSGYRLLWESQDSPRSQGDKCRLIWTNYLISLASDWLKINMDTFLAPWSMRFNWKSDVPLLEKNVFPNNNKNIHEKKLLFCLLTHLILWWLEVWQPFGNDEERSLSVKVSMLRMAEQRDWRKPRSFPELLTHQINHFQNYSISGLLIEIINLVLFKLPLGGSSIIGDQNQQM